MDINIDPKTCLEENRENLCGYGLSKDFLHATLKHDLQKKEIFKSFLLKVKTSFLSDIFWKMLRQATDYKINYLQKTYLIED